MSVTERHEHARAILDEYDTGTEPKSIQGHNMRAYRLASALRPLITPPPVHDTPEVLAWKVLGDPYGAGQGWIGYRRTHEEMTRGIVAGIQAAWDANPIVLKAALALWQADTELAPEARTLEPQEMRELHDALVAAGQIEPDPEFTD